MSTKEANKIIAEYMKETEYIEYLNLNEENFDTSRLTKKMMLWARLEIIYSQKPPYSKSLDALIKPINKYREQSPSNNIYNLTRFTFSASNPAEFLAINLAKAIKKL